MTPRKFNLIVLGTGPAGTSVTYRCRDAGWSVAVVESRSPGGTCSQRGCDAKKPLVEAAALMDWFNRMHGKGIEGDGRINWTELIKFKRTFTDPIPDGTRLKLANAGIDLFEGQPQFEDENTIRIGDKLIAAQRIVIATGSRTSTLDIPGEELLVNSDGFLELDELPDQVTFIGGGYISFEFAHVTARAGVDTTIIERNDRVLKGFDPEVVEKLLKASESAGIKVEMNRCAERVARTDNGFVVGCRGGGWEYPAKMVVHGAGREPSIDGLQLEKANIEYSSRGIIVNEYMQSISNPSVYAAGDVSATEGQQLTSIAGMEGSIVARNILQGNHETPDYAGIPIVLFTTPPLASVGLREDQAREQELDFTVKYEDVSDRKAVQQLGFDHAAYKVLLEKITGRVLGAHLLGPNAIEVINIFAMAIRLGLTADDIKRSRFSYPSSVSTIGWVL